MALDAVTEAPVATAPKPRSFEQRTILTLSKVWSWLFLLILIVFFSFEGTGFVSVRNSQNILVAITPILLMGLGQTFVIIAGGIDLSVGWVMGLASVVSALVIRDTVTLLTAEAEHQGLSNVFYSVFTAIGAGGAPAGRWMFPMGSCSAGARMLTFKTISSNRPFLLSPSLMGF